MANGHASSRGILNDSFPGLVPRSVFVFRPLVCPHQCTRFLSWDQETSASPSLPNFSPVLSGSLPSMPIGIWGVFTCRFQSQHKIFSSSTCQYQTQATARYSEIAREQQSGLRGRFLPLQAEVGQLTGMRICLLRLLQNRLGANGRLQTSVMRCLVIMIMFSAFVNFDGGIIFCAKLVAPSGWVFTHPGKIYVLLLTYLCHGSTQSKC